MANICLDGFKHKGWWTTSYCASLYNVCTLRPQRNFTFYDETKRSKQHKKDDSRGGTDMLKRWIVKCVYFAANAFLLTHGHGNHWQAEHSLPERWFKRYFFRLFMQPIKMETRWWSNFVPWCRFEKKKKTLRFIFNAHKLFVLSQLNGI